MAFSPSTSLLYWYGTMNCPEKSLLWQSAHFWRHTFQCEIDQAVSAAKHRLQHVHRLKACDRSCNSGEGMTLITAVSINRAQGCQV
jgi:hypothetical protein